MCGITGFWQVPDESEVELLATARQMALRMQHRGPDDAGEWADPRTGVGFGFRRLAIVDLTATGHQPMESASGRYVIEYNGEVYNYGVIREELEQLGHQFQTWCACSNCPSGVLTKIGAKNNPGRT